MYLDDERIILTLDAGGTNFSFSAIQSGKVIVDNIRYKAETQDLQKSLLILRRGFQEVMDQCEHDNVCAISFAFPGPADYPNGIIDNVGNLPAFSGGVALGPYLNEIFKLPIFINNDGDLFTYGEAKFGLLPWLNSEMKKCGSSKKFENLIGITLGTGYGGGFYSQGQMHLGDNSNGMEVWTTRNGVHPSAYTEEGISKRGIINFYGDQNLTPKDIYEIAAGSKPGDQLKAKEAFNEFGQVIGDSLADLMTIFDGVVVIGGGLLNAKEFFFPKMLKTINGTICDYKGHSKSRIVQKVYDLENDIADFTLVTGEEITIPGTNKKLFYNATKKLGVGVSTLGTNKAVSMGAYAYALDQLDLEK
jgi:glucokinase